MSATSRLILGTYRCFSPLHIAPRDLPKMLSCSVTGAAKENRPSRKPQSLFAAQLYEQIPDVDVGRALGMLAAVRKDCKCRAKQATRCTSKLA